MYQKQALELPQVRVFLDLVRKSNAARNSAAHKDLVHHEPKEQNEPAERKVP